MRTIILKVICWLCVVAITRGGTFHNKQHIYSKGKDFYNKNYRHYSSKGNSLYGGNEVRLRHSRYPNLNGVMARLDDMQAKNPTIATTTSTTTTPVTTPSPYRRSQDNNLFLDNFDAEVESDDGDFEEDDDPFEGDIDDEEEDADFEDEKDDANDADASWQAEEATTEAALSSAIDYKIRKYTLPIPNQIEVTSRRKTYPEYTSPKSEANAAIQHALRMNKESRCRDPLSRVVSIQAEYPDPGKSYIPHCTVLHRCAEDTGCCPNHATSCAPLKQEVVNLYFYTTTIGKPGNKIEKLAFTNHTECACLEKPREATTSENASHEVSRSYRSHLPAKVITVQAPAPVLPRCKCPGEYTPILLKNSSCTCDCTDSNMDCGLIKRGNEYFSMKDRMCIQNKECSTPKCEYGPYITVIGRCPKRNEKASNTPTTVAGAH